MNKEDIAIIGTIAGSIAAYHLYNHYKKKKRLRYIRNLLTLNKGKYIMSIDYYVDTDTVNSYFSNVALAYADTIVDNNLIEQITSAIDLCYGYSSYHYNGRTNV